MEKIKLLIADPRELSRESLVRLLKSRRELQVLGSTNSQHVVELVEKLKPDVVIFNSQVDECGVECSCTTIIESVKQVSPQTQAVILCEPRKQLNISLVFQAGARGFLSKKISLTELVASILSVKAGELVIGAEFVKELFDTPAIGKTDEQEASEKTNFGLSQREKDVLMFLAKGISNMEIANNLFISKHTVKVHVSHILEKMHTHTRQQAALLALQTGLTTDQPGIDKDRMQNQS